MRSALVTASATAQLFTPAQRIAFFLLVAVFQLRSELAVATTDMDCDRMRDYCTHALYQHMMMTQCRQLCQPLVMAAANGGDGMAAADPDCYDRRPDLCSRWDNFCTSDFYTAAQKQDWCKQSCHLCNNQNTNEVVPPVVLPSGQTIGGGGGGVPSQRRANEGTRPSGNAVADNEAESEESEDEDDSEDEEGSGDTDEEDDDDNDDDDDDSEEQQP